MTLSQALFPSRSTLMQVLMVLAGTLFIAIAAQINVPYYPVPATFQTLAVLVVGLAYGSRLGAVTLLVYLAEGAMGLPVFANFNNAAAFVGPTAGFLFGFVAMAWLAGLAAERGLAANVFKASIVGLVLSALLYIPGIAWPMSVANAFGIDAGWVSKGLGDFYWVHFMKPFLVGDAIKAILAALVVTGAWSLFKKRG